MMVLPKFPTLYVYSKNSTILEEYRKAIHEWGKEMVEALNQLCVKCKEHTSMNYKCCGKFRVTCDWIDVKTVLKCFEKGDGPK